ncbi:pyruvate/2-oxoglutarate dehydrogenase complex, dehydrogenase component alpha subunit [Thioflavicoccus mobilis 8321]|uniref:Pyruvate/2-oxoglutarate dehydrogenase complex, dehydrogenase component alpha subunit n=1 Tax=Thioflavicoccus mobilis 8321 TaxID=765912 RepID=L0GXD7_9GAMM|nr:thiamine pyrophosphate-dependent dehydrogenase E1 component subunit alpha [Thioflavicoccus mobilis]AGA90477.1 pyruvate/2-oxoglutarate dehydrogenase complex, dehydrogenase component alpha subunit [Thioflavicoccus mobilis 8321]
MSVSTQKKLEMLRTMLLARRFEETLTALCQQPDKIRGMMILATGQEAVGSGVCAALSPEDLILTNHRSHHHLLARGADPKALMAEIFGRRTGCNKGKSGTLHMAVPEVNALCTTTVVGGGLPIAAGMGFAQQYRQQDAVTVCFFGDGSTSEGSFHESLNLAGLWRLPVIYVCENNGYAAAQGYDEHTPIESLAARADAYGMPGERVDGNDAPAVFEATRRARERALAGEGPTLIECMTYRWRGHGEGDKQLYQPAEEIAAWKKRCPIDRLSAALCGAGELSAAELADMRSSATEIVTEAVRFAEESPWPEPEEALDDVWAA